MVMILMLWQETSSLNQHQTIGPVSTFTNGLLGKNFLNRVVALVVGTSNPNALSLLDGGERHPFLLEVAEVRHVRKNPFPAPSWISFRGYSITLLTS